jgi:hypothetical protein
MRWVNDVSRWSCKEVVVFGKKKGGWAYSISLPAKKSSGPPGSDPSDGRHSRHSCRSCCCLLERVRTRRAHPATRRPSRDRLVHERPLELRPVLVHARLDGRLQARRCRVRRLNRLLASSGVWGSVANAAIFENAWRRARFARKRPLALARLGLLGVGDCNQLDVVAPLHEAERKVLPGPTDPVKKS